MKSNVYIVLRTLALIGVIFHLQELAANLLQSYDTLSPAYLLYYAKQQLARPLVGLVFSLLLWVLARPFAAWICRGSSDVQEGL